MRTLALAGLATVAAVIWTAPTHAAFPGANGRIAFGASAVHDDSVPPTSSRSIDTALPSGRSRRSLRSCLMVNGEPDHGDCSIEYRSPAWSASGRQVAFDAGFRLALIRSDGTGYRLLRRRTADCRAIARTWRRPWPPRWVSTVCWPIARLRTRLMLSGRNGPRASR